ncbi:hypothetical protein ACQR1H_03250 [Bradyrhizobium sp. HKCCYLRH2015]|uniref:hypothetical protein n=1 Tax=Bradyrhizobium sp. HKCCYLRH2015 TaxID=3420742 RepID=UPI003EBA8FDF
MALIDIPVFFAGVALGAWLFRKYGLQGEALAKKLEADAAALQAKAAAIRAALGA